MQTISWSEFSDKHKNYIRAGIRDKMSVAEGSVRAGKTIDNCIIACAYLEVCQDKIHLASGSTIGNAKLNIGDCNGFGLEHLFAGRCRWGKYKDNDALFIRTKTGEKIVIFAGGGKADSYKRILGNSYGLWIATEINEHYDSEDIKSSFIQVAMDRQIASKQPKILWDLNPCNPNHKIYKNYIDKYRKDGLLGGYNYGHFTINDNLSISEERKAEIMSQYDVTTVRYRRNILGERCVAEGLIYKDFADHPESYIMNRQKFNNEYKHKITHLLFGVDFGGNGSAHAFCCIGFTYNLREVIVLESERHECNKRVITPDILAELFVNFVERCYNEYRKGGEVYADSAEQVLIAGLRKAAATKRLPIAINNAKKNAINERINLVLKLMAMHRFFVLDSCQPTISALTQAVWNNKLGHEDERLDDGSTPIDDLDAMEYALEPHLADLKY